MIEAKNIFMFQQIQPKTAHIRFLDMPPTSRLTRCTKPQRQGESCLTPVSGLSSNLDPASSQYQEDTSNYSTPPKISKLFQTSISCLFLSFHPSVPTKSLCRFHLILVFSCPRHRTNMYSDLPLGTISSTYLPDMTSYQSTASS